MNTEVNETNLVPEPPPTVPVLSTPKKRGFAAMSKEAVQKIASKGGKAAHAAGTAHQFSTAEAREAGKKGGTAFHIYRGRRRVAPTPPPVDNTPSS